MSSLSVSLSDSDLQHLLFCSRCDTQIINTKLHFFKVVNKDLFIFQVSYPQDDYLCKGYLNEAQCKELFFNDIIRDIGQFLQNDKICGGCIEKLRKYIHYFENNPRMYIILPYDFDGEPFIDESDSDYSEEEEESSHDAGQQDN